MRNCHVRHSISVSSAKSQSVTGTQRIWPTQLQALPSRWEQLLGLMRKLSRTESRVVAAAAVGSLLPSLRPPSMCEREREREAWSAALAALRVLQGRQPRPGGEGGKRWGGRRLRITRQLACCNTRRISGEVARHLGAPQRPGRKWPSTPPSTEVWRRSARQRARAREIMAEGQPSAEEAITASARSTGMRR